MEKKDAAKEVVEAVARIEGAADEAFPSLAILQQPLNVAVWGLLTGGIELIENEIAKVGDNSPHLDAALINAGIFLPIAIDWVHDAGRRPSSLSKRCWTPNLRAGVKDALFAAVQYAGFMSCFPMWHENRYAAELLSDSIVRFTAPEGMRHRQVSAYHKSVRPSEGIYHQPRAQKQDLSPQVQKLFAEVFARCMKKGSGFRYDQPWDLWRAMLPPYEARSVALVKRPDTLSLGGYSLGEFRRFYAALMTLCAVHEYLCFRWYLLRGVFPIKSALMVRRASAWSDILAELSGIADHKCGLIIGDITLKRGRWSDLHIYPFVALDTTGHELALAYPFPLHSNVDENILRVCSTARRAVFDAASLDKEGGMREELSKRFPHYACFGSLALTKPTPDLDMVITDEKSSAIALLELKWIRKPFGQFERNGRDADVLKGLLQLSKMRQFLQNNPSYLSSYRNLPRPLDAYENIYYLVVARDHWPWAEPDNGIFVVDFAAFSSIVGGSTNLNEALKELKTYDWLPVEGRDFTVAYETHAVDGVRIEAETFYPH